MKVLFFNILLLFCVVQGRDLLTERNFMMPLAAAAYSNDPTLCLLNIQKYWDKLENDSINPTLYRQYSVRCDSLNDTCTGFIAIDTFGRNIYVVFKGTTNFKNFYQQNLNFNEMVPFVAGGKVNKQFFDAFNALWINGGMKDDVLILKNKYLDFTFDVVGHSVGGAMAVLAVTTIVSTDIVPSDWASLTTFGQPRTGDKDFAHAVQNTLSFAFLNRVIHNHDIVPHFPFSNQSVYYHHIAEIWYPNDMQEGADFKACRFDDEDPKCSNSLDTKTLIFDDHYSYYGRNFIDYGINGCSDLASSKNVKKSASVTKIGGNLISKILG